MQDSARIAITGFHLATKDPGEHHGDRSPHTAMLNTFVHRLAEKFSDLLIEHIEVIIDIIGPHVHIG